MRILILFIAVMTGGAYAADIYYEDGTHVLVPDDWVTVRKPDDCKESVDESKQVRQQGLMINLAPVTADTLAADKSKRQQDLFDD